jgi:hypothetical protein
MIHSASTTTEGKVSRSEIDNHADTCCFGANFTPLYFTGQVCDVSPFSDSYNSMENVEVCAAATAWDDPNTGHTHILEYHQGLWFGDKLPNSLINPNQSRMFGISLCDDPFDPYRELEMHDPESSLRIPLGMFGSTCFFDSRVPTRHELDYYPRIVMTSDELWDPSSLRLTNSSSEEEEYNRIVSSVHINRETVDCNPDEPQMDDNANDNDVLFAGVSSSMTIESMLPRILASIRTATYLPDNPQEDERKVTAIGTKTRHSQVSPEDLSRKWRVGIGTARQTLKATTQRGIRTAVHPLTRRYRTDHFSNRYKRLNTQFYSDTVFATTRSLKGMTCAQVFMAKDFIRFHPMESKSECAQALQVFAEDVGIPSDLLTDGATELTGPKSKWRTLCRELRTKTRESEPYTQRQNEAETSIRELKKRWKHKMVTKGVHARLWDYGCIHQSEIMSRVASGRDGRTGIERITGETPDISEWLDFDIYDLVWVWDNPNAEVNPRLARWLGVAHRIGSDLCYWVINDNGNVLARTTVQHVTDLDRKQPETAERIKTFDEALSAKLGDANHELPDVVPGSSFFLEDLELGDGGVPIPEVDDPVYADGEEGAFEQDEFTEDVMDGYLNAELLLPDSANNMVKARVLKRAKGEDGNPIGLHHKNPLFDTREYTVEFPDGTTAEYQANIIAETLFSQSDSEGKQYMIMKEICDHKKDGRAIPISDGFTTSKNGNKVPKKTTIGWQFLVEWKDGSSDWTDLKDLKESNPVEIAEYAVSNKLVEEPAFKWWVADVLRRRNRIISKLKSRYWKTTHKFGIRVPKTVDEAYKIDQETGTDLWTVAINKEMAKVKVAFNRWDGGTLAEARDGKILVGYQEIGCHMIFDIKMDGNFTRKARLVAGGHTTDTPASVTYSSVVSRESVRLAFLIAGLNDLDVYAADISNAYLHAPCREKIWTVAGKEFGSDSGCVMLVVRALYGLKSSGASWRAMLAQSLTEIGYASTRADPDVWIRAAFKPDGTEYYEMVLVYVDDILHLSHDVKPTMKALEKLYELKPGSCGPPTMYLGANISKYQLEDGRSSWCMSARDYVKNAVKNVEEELLKEDHTGLKSKADRPTPAGYRPETDVSPELDDDKANRYQQLIGVLRWACELGRVDFLFEISLLASHTAMPRRGHLEAVYHIFAYLKQHLNSTIVFDDRRPLIDEESFLPVDWGDFYGNQKEEMPPRMPKARGKSVRISCFVDADHAGNVVTRRSHTGILMFVNNALISWFSKRQNTVETSTFGSEFVALRIATEQMEALRYKLRMFGVPIDGPGDVYCDNQSVVESSSLPQRTLQKKHNAICFHKVREAAAMGMIRVAKIDGTENLADLFTKVLPTAVRKKYLLSLCY